MSPVAVAGDVYVVGRGAPGNGSRIWQGEFVDVVAGPQLLLWEWVKWPLILALLIALIAVLYHYTPNVRPPKFAWLSLGSIIAILGIAIAGVALYIYFRFFGGYSAYGAVGGVMALLLTLWVFNIVLLFGVEVDAEAERARELQADLPAEDNIQLPPRAVKQAEKQKKSQDQLEREASELREQHGGKTEDADGESDRRDQRDRGGSAQPGAGSTPSSGLDAE